MSEIKDQIVLRYEVTSCHTNKGELQLKLWLFWKDKFKTDAENYIGSGEKIISKALGISQKNATLLMIKKIEEMILVIGEDKELKMAFQKRLKNVRYNLGIGRRGKYKRKPKNDWMRL